MRGIAIGSLVLLAAAAALVFHLDGADDPPPRSPDLPLPAPRAEPRPPTGKPAPPDSPPEEMTPKLANEIVNAGKRVVAPETIRKLLGSPDVARRRLGIGLAPFSTGDPRAEILEASRDPDPRVRARAVLVTGSQSRLLTGNESIVVRALSDSDPWVRRRAADAYPKLPRECPGLVDAVMNAATNDPDLGVRDDVLRGIDSLAWSKRVVAFALASLREGDYPPYVFENLCETVIQGGRAAELLDALPRADVAQRIVETVYVEPGLDDTVARVMPRLFALYHPYVEDYWGRCFDLALRTGHPDLVRGVALSKAKIRWMRVLAIQRVVKAGRTELAVELVREVLRTGSPELREDVLNELPLEPPYRDLVERAAREDPNEWLRAGQAERLEKK